MLLAIDIGNTNIVFATFRGAEVSSMLRYETAKANSVNDLSAWLKEELNGAEISGVCIASVVPDKTGIVIDLCKGLGLEPIVVGNDGVELGAKILTDKPEEVGADRVVNAVAVAGLYQAPAIVVDFGTATTLDVVDQGGNYSGGVIAPGVNLSLKALHEAAAKLPEVSVDRPDAVVGKNTVACMQSGIYWGYISMVEGLAGRIAIEAGFEKPFVIATGGLANLIKQDAPFISKVDNDLTLQGLRLIYEKNS